MKQITDLTQVDKLMESLISRPEVVVEIDYADYECFKNSTTNRFAMIFEADNFSNLHQQIDAELTSLDCAPKMIWVCLEDTESKPLALGELSGIVDMLSERAENADIIWQLNHRESGVAATIFFGI